MLKERVRAVREVTEKLNALEVAIDDALICAGELTSTTSAARQRANLSALVGQDAIALSGEAVSSLHQARARIVAAHHAFAEVREAMGLKTVAGGDLWKIVPFAEDTDHVKLVHSDGGQAA